MSGVSPTLRNIVAQIGALLTQRHGEHHRAAVLLAGRRSWGRAVAAAVSERFAFERQLWISSDPPAGADALPAAKAHKELGRELDAVIFDAFSGFDPDAFGAISGAIHGGGLLLLLTPPLDGWASFDDPEQARIAVHPWRGSELAGRYLRHLVRVIEAADGLRLLIEEEMVLPPLPPSMASAVSTETPSPGFATTDQERAVAAIEQRYHGHPHRPLVLTSDRGRGKSAALGIAAAHLLLQGVERIVVTAPRLDAVDALFSHAALRLPQPWRERGLLRAGGAAITFSPPDALLQERPEAQLLLVDEAAAIPAPMLERMLAHYPRIVFATTLHGYEGTGRGFAVRFQQVLARECPGWQSLRLEMPVRWAAGDPLEALVFKTLLLDAAPASEELVAGCLPESITFERVDRDRLLEHPALLRELFGLLVLAHYRTTPNDLRNLLDGPNLTLWLGRCGGAVVATALVAEEGGFDAELAAAVYRGERRPRGHLIPQSLALHAGFVEAPQLVGYRVMRIAIHPALQGRSIGSRLIGRIVDQARCQGVDYVGASFGMTEALLAFWSRLGFRPLRVGLRREASSGSHSLIVAHPLTPRGEGLLVAIQRRFAAQLPLLLGEPLRDLEPELATALLAADAKASPGSEGLDAQDRRDLESFVRGWRGYELCLVAVHKLCAGLAGHGGLLDLLDEGERGVLVGKVLEQRGWQEVAAASGSSGRREAEALLRQAVGKVLARDPLAGGG